MKLPHKTLERKLFRSGYKNIIAVDEVGMGALAGPVVVCAVLFTKNFYKKAHKKLHWLRDSKLLGASQRENFAHELKKEKNLRFQLAYCYPKTIDRVNIYQAARLAMRRAIVRLVISNKLQVIAKISGLKTYNLKLKTIILIDGKNKINGLSMEQLPVIKGDRKVFAIACASILAKVYRDKMMSNYANKYSEYGFEKHKGYGTKLHNIRLVQYGVSKLHRKSFLPVSRLI